MKQIWAPWRLQYILGDDEPSPGCFLCEGWRAAGDERKSFVLARGDHAFVLLNRYPYSNAHLMVAPAAHVGEIEDVDPGVAAEVWALTTLCKAILKERVSAQGCNIGINQGKCAGAGVLEHLHVHIVPRWEGDSNFMAVMDDVRVLPQALGATYDHLLPAFDNTQYSIKKDS